MNLRNSYLQDLQTFYNTKASEGFVYVKGMDFKGNEKLSPESSVFIKNRKVHIDDFYMCDHPVTQDEFKAVFPKGYTPNFTSDAAEGEIQGNRPADSVGWYAAIAYCNKRSVMEGLTPCYTIPGVTDVEGFSWESFPHSSSLDDTSDFFLVGKSWDKTVYNSSVNGYRLPTEAEWEYAARSGAFLESFEYSGSDDINEVAWYNENSSYETHEVKKKAPNKLGLYDMSGNVGEWCWDLYGVINMNTPSTGNASGSCRVLRGGSWDYDAFYCTMVSRGKYPSYMRERTCGFRVVRSSSN